jgi:hypothetical protein
MSGNIATEHTHNIYRDGMVHQVKHQCSTCIYRPGNLMHLADSRRDALEAEAITAGSVIVCHSTLLRTPQADAACAGFVEATDPQIIQLAERMGVLHKVKALRFNR